MNIGYVIDLSNVLGEKALVIPYLDGLYYRNSKSVDLAEVLNWRNDVMKKDQPERVDKHLFFFVVNNDDETTLINLSKCIKKIQQDTIRFHREENELHVVYNLVDENGKSIKDFETIMCLAKTKTDLSVSVYTWIIDNYDYSSVSPISDLRRSHAIARLITMLCKQRQSIQLKPFVNLNGILTPTYNLFGDSSVFFDEEGRNEPVRNYYRYLNLQHLLNLPNNRRDIGGLDDYMNANVIPYSNDPKALDKSIDATSEEFLKNQREPIQASRITEKTQGLLLKSTEDDEEYLVNASDKKLVFLQELRDSGGWQLEGMDVFLTTYQDKVALNQTRRSDVNGNLRVVDRLQDRADGLFHNGESQEIVNNESQESVSNEFLDKLYMEKYTVHEEGFDNITNKVSDNQKAFVEKYKQHIDIYLNDFLNQHGDENYDLLQDPLTSLVTARHRSNIDYGIAFMEYLKTGKGDYLVDQEVSMGDINFMAIRDALVKEESKCRNAYETKKKEIEDKYKTNDNDQPSKIKLEIGKKDQKIEQCRKEKLRCDYQIDHWINEDADKKLTAKTKTVMSLAIGILAAVVWIVISIKWLSNFMESVFEHYGRFQWEVFGGLIMAGIIVGIVIILKALRRRKEAEKALGEALKQKKIFMNACVKEMVDVTEMHYDFILARYGSKTMNELIDYVQWKKDDIIHFRKALFKLLIYNMLFVINKNNVENKKWEDGNTIELVDDKDVKSILFGSESARMVPCCFAQNGIVLSDTFAEFRRKKARLETTRNSLSHTSKSFDQASLEKEVIACMREDEKIGLEYTPLKKESVLPSDEHGVEMDDVRQGSCGDCYFMATLAAIAKMKPNYIIGKTGMVEELGDEHRFFRVKFYDKDGNRVDVDIDNRFWNLSGQPYYAKQGKTDDPEGNSYDPWVMAVEKAWAKANNDGYDGIEGTSQSKERMRRVEYSFAVTGKSAFYCMTKNVPDGNKLQMMIKKHFCEDKLPITLYSVSKEDANKFADPNIVHNHAYALKNVYDDGTFDVFNPWNSHEADEDIRGKHYEKVDINFIKNNFDVVVFFGIQEADFDSFERDLTQNAAEDEVTKNVERVLDNSFTQLELDVCNIEDLLKEKEMSKLLDYSNYLFSKSRLKDTKGAEGDENHLLFLEGGEPEICDNVNQKLIHYLETHIPGEMVLQQMLYRIDDRQSLTLFRLSPHYVLVNFCETGGKENHLNGKNKK